MSINSDSHLGKKGRKSKLEFKEKLRNSGGIGSALEKFPWNKIGFEINVGVKSRKTFSLDFCPP